jgi:hypothetical protein
VTFDSPKSPNPNLNNTEGFPRSSSRTSISSLSGLTAKDEEGSINMEYLRNVIIKFLESKSTRVKKKKEKRSHTY